MRSVHSVWPFVFLAAGCARYQAQPLDERRILEDLRALTLESASPALPAGAAPAFDPSDGLSEREASALAVALNPDLKAQRAERGVAEAQLLAAGLLPDPEIDARWLRRDGETLLEGSLLQLLPLPGERGLKKEKARLRIEEVDLSLAAAEWHLVQQVRSAFTDLLAAKEAARIRADNLGLRERVLALLEKRRELGAATQLEVNLAALDASHLRRELKSAESQRDLAHQQLNRLLGLGPKVAYALEVERDPWALRTDKTPSLESMEETALTHRLDLAASKRAYEQAERDLALAVKGQYPKIRVGPSVTDEDAGTAGGIGVGVELPAWNRNRGEIAEKTARREKLAQAYRAEVAALRSDLAFALTELERQEALVRYYDAETKPKLEQNLSLVEASLKAGKLDATALLLVQDRMLQARQEDLEVRAAYRKALIHLEETLGAPLEKQQP